MSNLFVGKAKESAVDVVINSIKQLIAEDKLKLGDKLPSELEISEGLGISRGSVREAMKVLEALGVVDIKVGNGTYIVDKPRENLIDPLMFKFLLIKPELSELKEFRRLFETDIITLAIMNFNKNEKERKLLEYNVERLKSLKERKSSPKEMADNDLEFHKLLGEACKNSIAERIYSFVISFFESSIYNSHMNQEYGENALETHQAILSVIEERNTDKVKDAVGLAVDNWEGLQKRK